MSFEISDNVEIFLVGIFDEELKECPVCISKYTHIHCIVYIIQSGTFGALAKRTSQPYSFVFQHWEHFLEIYNVFVHLAKSGPIKVFDLETGSLA